jgi:hypothetical protein
MSKLRRPSRAITPTLTCEQDINKQARQAHTLSKQGTHSYIHTYMYSPETGWECISYCNIVMANAFLMKGSNITVSHLWKAHIYVIHVLDKYIHTYTYPSLYSYTCW